MGRTIAQHFLCWDKEYYRGRVPFVFPAKAGI